MAGQAYINPYSIIMGSTLALVFLQMFSIIMVKLFDKSPIYLGPFMVMLLIAGAVYAAFGLLEKIIVGEAYNIRASYMASYILMLGISIILIALLYFVLPQWVPELFRPVVGATRASFGLP